MSDAGRIPGLYERHAGAYDRDRSRGLMERAWLDAFLAIMPEGGAALDLGCGMGEPIAAYLVARGRRVVGIDTSPSLVALARARLPGETWRVADMRDLALGRAFAGIVAWDSLFHLEPAAQRGLFPVFAVHAAPGAALLFTSGPQAGVAIGRYGGEPLYHASLAPAEYRALLEAHGFRLVEHRAEDPDCGGHTVWLARRVSPAPPA